MIGESDVPVEAICTHRLYPVKMYSLSCCHAGISCHVSVCFLLARFELGSMSGARSGLSSGPAKTRVSANSSNARRTPGSPFWSAFDIVLLVGRERSVSSIPLPHLEMVGGLAQVAPPRVERGPSYKDPLLPPPRASAPRAPSKSRAHGRGGRGRGEGGRRCRCWQHMQRASA